MKKIKLHDYKNIIQLVFAAEECLGLFNKSQSKKCKHLKFKEKCQKFIILGKEYFLLQIKSSSPYNSLLNNNVHITSLESSVKMIKMKDFNNFIYIKQYFY